MFSETVLQNVCMLTSYQENISGVWHKLHARILCQLPSFKKSAVACKKKFNSLFKMYKEDKVLNGISGESRHECIYFEKFDAWRHQASSVMKHVSGTAHVPDLRGDNEKHADTAAGESSDSTPPQRPLQRSTTKSNFHSEALVLSWCFSRRW